MGEGGGSERVQKAALYRPSVVPHQPFFLPRSLDFSHVRRPPWRPSACCLHPHQLLVRRHRLRLRGTYLLPIDFRMKTTGLVYRDSCKDYCLGTRSMRKQPSRRKEEEKKLNMIVLSIASILLIINLNTTLAQKSYECLGIRCVQNIKNCIIFVFLSLSLFRLVPLCFFYSVRCSCVF